MQRVSRLRRGYSGGGSAPPGKGRQGGDRPCAGPVAKVGPASPNHTIRAKSVNQADPLKKSPDPA